MVLGGQWPSSSRRWQDHRSTPGQINLRLDLDAGEQGVKVIGHIAPRHIGGEGVRRADLAVELGAAALGTFLRFVIAAIEAEAERRIVAFGPLEVIYQRPEEITFNRKVTMNWLSGPHFL